MPQKKEESFAAQLKEFWLVPSTEMARQRAEQLFAQYGKRFPKAVAIQGAGGFMQKVPLYKQIKSDIKAKIMSGELKAGDLVFSEAEIMNNYKVSQITAKNALTGLVNDGSIYRIQGRAHSFRWSPDTDEKIAGSSIAADDRKRIGMIGVLSPYLKKSSSTS